MIRKFGGSSGVEFQPQGIDLGVGGGSNIKSIQRIEITPWNNTTNKTVDITINSVDVNSTIVLIRPSYDTNAYPDDDTTYATLKNATTVTIDRYSNDGTSSAVMYIDVVEFENVKSKQSGIVNGSGNRTAVNVTINSVNLSKSIIFTSQLFMGSSAASFHYQSVCGAKFTTNTNLSIYSVANSKVAWQVIEFN